MKDSIERMSRKFCLSPWSCCTFRSSLLMCVCVCVYVCVRARVSYPYSPLLSAHVCVCVCVCVSYPYNPLLSAPWANAGPLCSFVSLGPSLSCFLIKLSRALSFSLPISIHADAPSPLLSIEVPSSPSSIVGQRLWSRICALLSAPFETVVPCTPLPDINSCVCVFVCVCVCVCVHVCVCVCVHTHTHTHTHT